jgi:hypothetical protein
MVPMITTSNEVVSVPSRNGDVLMFPNPVCVTYERPYERVLFSQSRDANPFFHLYESLWMLAGRNDLEPLQYFVQSFGNYSDDGRTLNGAYGYRWRHAQVRPSTQKVWNEWAGVDQLELLIKHLKETPSSRRAVLQMWNVKDDLFNIEASKDVCCNLSVCFSVRQSHLGSKLDMAVFNRSNDLVWGMLGANAVHFSFLQEYLAICLGLEIGRYHQISNNLHLYKSTYKPEWANCSSAEDLYRYASTVYAPYETIPLVTNIARFEQELPVITDYFNDPLNCPALEEPFLAKVAKPMLKAFYWHKQRDYPAAIAAAQSIGSFDWRAAAIMWITKREQNWRANHMN